MAIDRRHFLKTAAGALAPLSALAGSSTRIALVRAQPTTASARLARSLTARGLSVAEYSTTTGVPKNSFVIRAQVVPALPHELAFDSHAQTLLASGSTPRGLAYALLDLADRVEQAGPSNEALHAALRPQARAENPHNAVRAVSRLFVSDVHDKPWFNDREMWPAYFEMLAANRFNRFHLAFGIGYDFLREVTDSYFVFAYPFFVSPPGYNVRAVNLPDAERDRNLETLKYISEQAAAHHLDFQLGLWTHGYEWSNSPNANYTIAGLSAGNHAAYCRDALQMLLRACPAITGVTFRIHGESGVAEGNYPFWKTVFDGIVNSGRKLNIDLHSKGLDDKMLETALGTGMPVIVSPKFWAEHMGLPYHQADIRGQEIPKGGRDGQGLMALSTGSRSFTRYGYADLLRSDRQYGVIHRIWSGSRRIMLWGDPQSAAAYSRAFQFCGSQGVDLMEPLSFKGRRGSGLAGSRCGYADLSLDPRWDWQKFLYTYRVWGRAMYNPASATPPTAHAEIALAEATRILPTITTAHAPSAANNNYWPEMYSNQAIVSPGKNQYSDTPAPKVFGNTSPLDPQLFSTVNGFAAELLDHQSSGKYSPVEVATWLEGYALSASSHLAQAEAARRSGGGKVGAKAGSKVGGKAASGEAELRRLAVDVKIQSGIGLFFAHKLRAGVLFAIYERTADRAALEAALDQYRKARAAWAQLSADATGVYVSDVTAGEQPWLRGHWSDRLPAMDADIQAMAALASAASTQAGAAAQPAAMGSAGAIIHAALRNARRAQLVVRHQPAQRLTPKSPLAIDVEIELGKAGAKPSMVRLCYRHVNQAERFQYLEMDPAAKPGAYHAAIPGDYTDSVYPVQYYFEVHQGPDVRIYPGLGEDLMRQPYFVVTA